VGITLRSSSSLSVARGWICATPAAEGGTGTRVVLAGGGYTSGGPAGTTNTRVSAADILDVGTGNVVSVEGALVPARWGDGCATVGATAYFAGGASESSGYVATVTQFDSSGSNASGGSGGGWSEAPIALSSNRESACVASAGGLLVAAGGWARSSSGSASVSTVDAYVSPAKGGAMERTTLKLASAAFDVGCVGVGAAAAVVVVGNNEVVTVTASGAGGGSGAVQSTTVPLPPVMGGGGGTIDGGGLVPGSHVQQNGVAVGPYACFYGGSDNATRLSPALYCLHTERMRWTRLPCSVAHHSGAVATVGNATVVVGGGFDPTAANAPPTDVVDVFELDL
jgi:hypothetical protein